MAEESPERNAAPNGAVFISYASEDAAAAGHIASALRAAGIEVWFDQSELRGGDAWDAAIRKQIRACALFIAVISASAHTRTEGYFRLEWKLAIDRSHLMSPDKAFLLPVVIDDTPRADERIPERLRELQWTRLPEGQVPAAFVARVLQLLSPRASDAATAAASRPDSSGLGRSIKIPRPLRRRSVWLALGVAAAVLAYPIADKWRLASRAGRAAPAAHPDTPGGTASPAVPEKSIAVLPLIDMSDRKDQQYLADGLTEELIERLGRVPGLQVSARTSSFYFKGKQATVAEIARALGVAHLLEGSVRKSGNMLRIATQLVQGDTGYQAWSEQFEQPLTDVFKIQDRIAAAVVQKLKMSILEHYLPEPAPTSNLEAYTLYLQALSRLRTNGADDYEVAIRELTSAVRLDPRFASAWAQLSLANVNQFDLRGKPTEAACTAARSAADHALRLSTTLVWAHSAQALIHQSCEGDLTAAEAEFRRALALQPGSAPALRGYAWVVMETGRLDEALQFAQRAVAIDPLNGWSYAAIGDVQRMAGRLAEAEQAYRRALELIPTVASLHALQANVLMSMHKGAEAVAEAKLEPDAEWRATVLPFALDAAGRGKEAEQAIAAYLAREPGDYGTAAEFYACRHDNERALEWLGKFAARHEGVVEDLPNRVACLKNLEGEPRYQTLERQMKADPPKPTSTGH
jgi:TolB-like protein/Tfp pilus assembly protein PilF